jgi:hypothetical protein
VGKGELLRIACKTKDMNRFTLLHIEWNCLNGFIFQVCGFDFENERALIGIYLSRDFVHIELCGIYFEIWNERDKKQNKG